MENDAEWPEVERHAPTWLPDMRHNSAAALFRWLGYNHESM
jgi:hypothetical protein